MLSNSLRPSKWCERPLKYCKNTAQNASAHYRPYFLKFQKTADRIYPKNYCTTAYHTKYSVPHPPLHQSWALSVFFNFFNNKK